MTHNEEAHLESSDTKPSDLDPLAGVETSIEQLSALLGDLNINPQQPPTAAFENRLVEVRLGIASGLFAALRHKHAPSAAHSLRVALGCSSWAFALNLDPAARDELEIAALLHDIGKIGAPDRLLLKPGPLENAELKLMNDYRRSGLDLLAGCCPSRAIVDIIYHSAAWYDGSRSDYPLVGEQIPPGARMLAIVDAFDSMTSEQVYRRAMSYERALHELFGHAGTQFDPQLVKSFSELHVTVQLHREVAGHWLNGLDPRQSNRFWHNSEQGGQCPRTDSVFQQKLLDNMYDAVIFVDRNMQILQWNRGAERLTGIPAAGAVHHSWSPAMIGMRSGSAAAAANGECPIAYSITSGVQSLRRAQVTGRDKRIITVDVHTVPVVDQAGTVQGAAMLMHDASPEASLEEQCQSLHERATRDPLTQVANRAEFDRTHQLFIEAHLERRLPCSLIICDIDHFKIINDTYGHQAGDDVLRGFGTVLRSECRPGDLVARYGGEEFVLLCADSNNAAATARAERLRKMIAETSQPALGGKPITVSFGVTEIQPGDSCDSMLRRADRALLEAKRTGRNTVVQLGDGLGDVSDKRGAPVNRGDNSRDPLLEQVLITVVPLNIAVEKLRGFVIDHDAEILSVIGDRVEMQIDASSGSRRRADQRVPFVVELLFAEQRVPVSTIDGRSVGRVAHTRVKVAIRLKRARDRRQTSLAQQARAVAAGIRSYLMAIEASEASEAGTWRPTNVVSPLLNTAH